MEMFPNVGVNLPVQARLQLWNHQAFKDSALMAERFGHAEYAPRKKYTKLSRGVDGQVQCRIGKKMSSVFRKCE